MPATGDHGGLWPGPTQPVAHPSARPGAGDDPYGSPNPYGPEWSPPGWSAARPSHTPPGRTAALLLPLLAIAALVLVGVSVFLPWRAGTPFGDLGISSTGLGISILVAALVLVVPALADLFAGRVRVLGLVAVPGLVLGAAAVTVAVGTLLSPTLRAPTLDADGLGALTFLLGAVGATVIGAVAAVGFVRRWGAPADEAPRGSSRRGPVLAAVGAATVVVVAATVTFALAGPASTDAAPAGTTPAASPSVSPAAFTGATGTMPGPRQHAAAVTPTYGDTKPSTPCPSEAASTMPEAAGAVVVAHAANVHVALCRGTSGRLYYYGANDVNRRTITLPAQRSEDSWIVQNQGTTYYLTEDSLEISGGATPQVDQTLQGGW